MALVVDDSLLLDVLAGLADAEIQDLVPRGELFTTGCWYFRLSRALNSPSMTGALSRKLGGLDSGRQNQVLHALDDLPPEIGLINFRDLVPIMSALQVTHPINMLNAEALAAGVLLDADLAVTTDSPILREGAARIGLAYRVVPG